MAHIELADNFPALEKIDLSATTITCSYWLVKHKRHCSRSVKLDPAAARQLQKNLLMVRAATHGSLTSDLRSLVVEDLLECSCCWQHKTKLHSGTLLGEEVRRRWQDQLNIAAPEGTAVKTTVAPASCSADVKALDIRLAGVSAIPGPNLRSGRYTPFHLPDDAVRTPEPEFLPMKKPGRTVAQKILQGPSSEQSRRTRSLYAYGRSSSPGMLKIGVSQNVEARLEGWSRSCLYQPILKHHLKGVPCAQFVEGLTHSELLQYWRREIRCKHNPDCHTQHKEWFEVDDATAFRVMDSWVEWMRVAEPYDHEGRLKPIWRSSIVDMEANGVLVTSRRLLDVVESFQAKNTPQSGSAVATRVESTVARSLVDGMSATSIVTTTPTPVVLYGRATATVLSATALITSSLPTLQKSQLRALLNEGTPSKATSPLSLPTPLVPAV